MLDRELKKKMNIVLKTFKDLSDRIVVNPFGILDQEGEVPGIQILI